MQSCEDCADAPWIHGPTTEYADDGTGYSSPEIDWVIVGGESGAGARPMHPDWARDLRDQCATYGVPFLFKQWGEWREPADGERYDTTMGRAQRVPAFIVSKTGTVHCFENDQTRDGGRTMLRVGKRAAGRLLDGRTHDEFRRHDEERPILFSGTMVRAILEGRKTQTRRVMKPRRDLTVGCKLACCGLAGEVNTSHYSNSEFGAPGDRLWVRETHEVRRIGTETFDGGRPTRRYAGIAYQADGARSEVDIDLNTFQALDAKESRGWSPSIHMPRWASRITLEITGVRAERLQSIEWDEAIAEGIPDPRRAARASTRSKVPSRSSASSGTA